MLHFALGSQNRAAATRGVETTMSEELPREEGRGGEGLPAPLRRRLSWEESLRTWYARKTSEERPLCSKMAAWNFLAAALFFNLWGDVPSGCAFAVLMGSLLFANIGSMRAGRALHGLGLLLLAVAFVLISMKTHRVTSIPDPKCEPWAGFCQAGGQRDGRIECDDCADPATCVDRSAAGLWWSEEGALYFPASEKDGKYWGWGRTRRLNGCGIPKKPSKEGTDGAFGASGDKEQKRRWKEAKETGDCRPLFTSQAKCEDYWGRWQDAWSEEWGGACIVRLLFNAALLFYGFSFFSEIGPDILLFCLLTR